MTTRSALETGAGGATAGIIGGLLFAAGVLDLGTLPTIAGIVRSSSSAVGLLLHLVVSAGLGAAFSLMHRRTASADGSIILWGVLYGFFWWIFGALSLLPLVRGDDLVWSIAAAQQQSPALVGHLVFGLTIGVVHHAFLTRTDHRSTQMRGPSRLLSLVTGGFSGLGVALLLTLVEGPISPASIWLPMLEERVGLATEFTLAAGLLIGVAQGALRTSVRPGLGPVVVRGLLFGFVGWFSLGVSVVPALVGGTAAWEAAQLADIFGSLVPFLLVFGMGIAIAHHALLTLHRTLFAQDLRLAAGEGVGAQSVRAAVGGASAGLIGGVAFAVVVSQMGFTADVGAIVGSPSALVGLLVHMCIAVVIGASYGLLFRQRSFDTLSGIGWGVSYGLVWWFLGALTLLPLASGEAVAWSPAAAGAAFPSLVAHVVYGAFVGAFVHGYERRHNPWWVSRFEAESRRAAQATEQLTSSAPAVWALTLIVAVLLPVLVA